MKTLWRPGLVFALASLVWLAWQKPLPAPAPASVQTSLPPGLTNNSNADTSSPASETISPQQLWRVITHRVMSKEGITALQKRLRAIGLNPLIIRSMEDMTMHSFDDAVLFKSHRQAQAIAEFWQQHDIETNIIKAAKGVYLLGLGRLYQVKYAEGMQKKLDQIGRKYRYQKRRVPIPVIRFTFPPDSKQEAEKLWKKLNVTGVMMPVLMSETQFQKTYGSSIQPNIRP